MSASISLTNSVQFAIVDDADLDLVSGYSWHIAKDGRSWYARTTVGLKRKRTFSMHRLITGFPDKMIDHKDNNGLNNQRDNLRPVTRSQNAANARHHIDSKSRFKGVTFDKCERGKKKYRAQVCVRGKIYRLGRFETDLEAAHAYDAAAKEHFGEFAKVNFP